MLKNIKSVDRSGMINFCVNSAKLYRETAVLADKIKVNYPKPANVIVAGMGGSGIGGELLKDWAKKQAAVPIEVNSEYELPEYADKKTLVFVTSYSGDTEETLSAFLDALQAEMHGFLRQQRRRPARKRPKTRRTLPAGSRRHASPSGASIHVCSSSDLHGESRLS